MSDDVNRWRPSNDDHDRLLVLETAVWEYRNAMADRLSKLNELREQVTLDRQTYLRTDVYSAQHEDLRKRMEAANESLQLRHDTLARELIARIEANYRQLSDRIDPVSTMMSRMTGIGVTLMVLIALLGALMGHFWK